MPGPGDAPRRPPTASRIVLLAVVAFAAAVLAQFAIIAVGIDRDNPFRLFVTPILGALIVYLGLRGYPRGMRIRIALMVGVSVLLFSNVA